MTHDVVLKCPKCGKDGLVRLESRQDVFECVYCRYKDDLNSQKGGSDSDNSTGGLGFIPFVGLLILLMLLLT